MIDIALIPHTEVPLTWHLYSPLVQEALDYSRGECLLEDIYQMAASGGMQVWVAADEKEKRTAIVEAVMITQIIVYPRKRFLRIVVLAGTSVHRFDDGWEVIENWAIDQECHGVESFARRGFQRWAKGSGFREYYSVIGKDFPIKNLH